MLSDPIETLLYVHLPSGSELPTLPSDQAFRAVLIVEAPVTVQWQDRVSKWLVDSGCLYMMAWGPGCSSWDDSVDWANIESFESGDIPEDRFVLTTWHEGQSLEEAFDFCKACAKSLVTVALISFRSPLTSIIHTGNARHAELHGID